MIFSERKFWKWKKNELLQNQIVVLFKEKEVLSFTLQNTQKDFDAHKISCKAKFPIIDENEIFTLKNKINTLSNILKKCEFDKTRLEAMFFKRQTQRKPHTPHVSHAHTQHLAYHATHTSHAHAIHAHHAHTHHAFLYVKVYSCTDCDRKGHLAKFCYDRQCFKWSCLDS